MSALAKLMGERRDALVQRWMGKVRATLRGEQELNEQELLDSMHFFIDELINAMKRGRGTDSGVESTAQAHGAQRQLLSRDISELVREYGLFFECVVEECVEHCPTPFAPSEYALLVRCLNIGASEAVSEFEKLTDLERRRTAWDHFAFLAHEVRNPLVTARLAVALMKQGGAERGLPVLERSLAQLAEVVDHALVEARLRGLDAGATLHKERVDLRKLLEGAVADVQPDAEARQIGFAIDCAPALRLEADGRVLRSALSNLVRNAVKFTRSGGKVTIRGRPSAVEVEDECGGLQPGDEKKIFETFQQAGEDRTGFGLGLAIAQQAVALHGGRIEVRNLPGKGCVFAVTLPT